MPSAFVFAFASAEDASVNLPPATMFAPMVAFVAAFAIVIATAAATEIPPALVEALGVVVPPEPLPPFAAAVESA